MGPDTSRKRLHSALKEPPIAQERKRQKHESKSAQPGLIHSTKASSFEKLSLDLQPQNKPRSSNQAETPETPSSFVFPEPCSSQSSHLYIENFMKQGFAPDDLSSPSIIAAQGNQLPSNRLDCLKQTPTLGRAQNNAFIQSSQDSFDEKSIFTANAEHSSLNSSMFLLYFQ